MQPNQQLVVLDLCCGRGGWARGFLAHGWKVIGVDNNPEFGTIFPGQFVCADLLTWEGWRESGAHLVVASVPCEEFSRWSMPWTRAKNPPPPSLDLWNRAKFIAAELKVPIVLENVRGAQPFLGRSQFNCGPFHLWGDVPPVLPVYEGIGKTRIGWRKRDRSAMVPFELASHIAQCFTNQFRNPLPAVNNLLL